MEMRHLKQENRTSFTCQSKIEETLVVIADGARWIWKRVAELVTHCGLRKEQVYGVLPVSLLDY